MEQTMKFEESVLKFKKLNYVEGVDENGRIARSITSQST